MSVHFDHQFNLMEMECDHCNSEGEFEADNFQEGIDQFKEDGWHITQDSQGYDHKCPDCCIKELDELEDSI